MTDIGPGTRVRCIHKGYWMSLLSRTVRYDGPAEGHVCTVDHVNHGRDGIFLTEWPGEGSWALSEFVPLNGPDPLEVMRRAAKEIEKPARERVG